MCVCVCVRACAFIQRCWPAGLIDGLGFIARAFAQLGIKTLWPRVSSVLRRWKTRVSMTGDDAMSCDWHSVVVLTVKPIYFSCVSAQRMIFLSAGIMFSSAVARIDGSLDAALASALLSA